MPKPKSKPSVCSPAKTPVPPTPPSTSIKNPFVDQALVSACCGQPVKKCTRLNRLVTICKGCHYGTAAALKITRANLIPAYGRRPHTEAAVLDLLYRGMDYQLSPSTQYCSIRNMAEGALLQIRYGKRLHKVMCHKVDLTLKK